MSAIVELTRDEIDDLLNREKVGRIGCHADGDTYVVPVIYAYDGRAFVVASIEGRKIEMMRSDPRVCFEVDTYGTSGWESAIAQGRYVELATAEEVDGALDLLAERFGRREDSRRRAVSEATVVFRVEIDEITGRAVRR